MPTRSTRRLLLLAFTACLTCSPPSQAHHSATSWDLSHRIAITGQVKAVQFRNPHGLLRVVVAANNGKTAEWEVECSARNLLARRGWKFDAIKIGDKITISGHPHKYLTTHLYMREVILSNGTRFGDPAGKDSALD